MGTGRSGAGLSKGYASTRDAVEAAVLAKLTIIAVLAIAVLLAVVVALTVSGGRDRWPR